MKVTQMPPVQAANMVANSGNTAYAEAEGWWQQLEEERPEALVKSEEGIHGSR